MTTLEQFVAPDSTKPADLVAVLARVAGLRVVIDEREQQVRGRLDAQVRTLMEAAGGQFTVRAEAGTAYIAGGNPKPTVTDREAFASWYADEVGGGIITDRVEVLDHAEAARLLGMLDDHAGNRLDLATLAEKAFQIVPEYLLPDGALDSLVESGRAAVSDEHLVDTDTGEPIPGVTVRYSREQLTVRPDRGFRDRVASALRSDLPALDGGDA